MKIRCKRECNETCLSVRQNSIDKYERAVREGLQELFNLCRYNIVYLGDLLLCQQNGFIFSDQAYVGLVDEGLNSTQTINSISFKGIGGLANDDNYFAVHGNTFLKGIYDLIVIPEGSAEDHTRNKEYYDFTYNYQKDIGLKYELQYKSQCNVIFVVIIKF